MNKLRVGVLMGGRSIEKEVSFNSGRTVCDHLDTQRYAIVPIFQTTNNQLFILPWNFLYRGKIADFQHRLAQEAQEISWDKLKQHIDFMYIATHGRYAEDGTVQGFLEVLGIPYLGAKVFASALGMDKHMQKEILRMNGIAVPHGITITPSEIENYTKSPQLLAEDIKKTQLSFPLITKPVCEGSSLGVRKVTDEKQLLEALHHASTIHPGQRQSVVVEQALKGMEFSCIIITDYRTGKLIPLPPTEIIPEAGSSLFDYDQKYMPGRATKHTPARCSEKILTKIQETCIAATHALGFTTISRIDGFVTDDNKIVIVDPNSLSGMGPASFLFREAAEIGMSHTHVINHLIETELQAYGMLENIIKKEKKAEKTMLIHKLRVAVLMGGDSHEREISLESGRNICYKLSPHKYNVVPVFVSETMELFELTQSQLVRNSTKEITSLVQQSQKINWGDLPKKCDFVFIGLHGGKGENGSVQGTLEMLDLPYNGSSVLASGLCIDKYKTTQFLTHKGFDVPQSLLIAHDQWKNNQQAILTNITQTINFPLIVKPHDDGCSVMVQKINNKTDLKNATTLLFDDNKTHALVEEYVTGMELTVGVIGNETARALPPSQAVTTSGILSIEEKFLPGAGENQTPAPLSQKILEKIQTTMEAVYQAVGCKGYARIDCFYQSASINPTKKDRIIVLEINTLPGMTPATCIFHQAAEVGIMPMDFIDTIVTLGLEQHAHTHKAQLAKTTQKPTQKNI